jgi:hypothetical protein
VGTGQGSFAGTLEIDAEISQQRAYARAPVFIAKIARVERADACPLVYFSSSVAVGIPANVEAVARLERHPTTKPVLLLRPGTR